MKKKNKEEYQFKSITNFKFRNSPYTNSNAPYAHSDHTYLIWQFFVIHYITEANYGEFMLSYCGSALEIEA